ncbi:hypothetical protein [Stenotrophomonas tumulicola]|uniref:Uncharacterized protein n=1 Tax=Stenotrophomonas tumulicola TaxID=1685415 RepID=A0A7W3IJI9_9GAMM|nr:hypothetical protein [Stenotrophomonas tumulicola]MBA8682699.1 hypothetical protein [Stenotrophomonas tumulicola]
MNRHDPLTPEERELARLLGRPQDHGPGAAVDAAILAAARAAVQANPASPGDDAQVPAAQASERRLKARRRARWPTVFGVAASVVFAVGLAWQMRPEPPAAPVMEAHAPTPTSAPSRAAGGDQGGDLAEAPAAAPQAASAPPERAEVHVPPRAARAAVQDAPSEPVHPQAPAATAAPKSTGAPPAAPAPAPGPASAPAPPGAAAAPRVAAATRNADASVLPDASAASAAERVQRAPERHVGAAPAMARSLQRAPAASAPGVMGGIASSTLSAGDVQDQVLADSQLSRRKWLQKIRHRRDAGEVDLARASLERYLLQYPETRLPRDLQPLLSD